MAASTIVVSKNRVPRILHGIHRKHISIMRSVNMIPRFPVHSIYATTIISSPDYYYFGLVMRFLFLIMTVAMAAAEAPPASTGIATLRYEDVPIFNRKVKVNVSPL